MDEIFSFFTRAAVCVVYLFWAKRELKARFTRKRAAAAYSMIFLLWAGTDGMLLRLISRTALPDRWAGAVFFMAMADGLLFLGAMTVLFRKEESSSGRETERESKRGGKARMAAACFCGNVSAGAVLLLLWQLLRNRLSAASMQAVVPIFCIVFVLLQRSFVLALYRERLRLREKERQLSEFWSMQEETEFQERQYREMVHTWEEIRKLQHDMKNSFQLLYGLLEQGKTEEALGWLKQENAALAGGPDVIRTQSALVGTMLNGKLNYARSMGLSVSTKILASFSGIGERDLCRLLGNLLDNGIEAAVRTEKKTLDLVLQGDESRLLIEVENAADHPLVLEDRRAQTDKEDRVRHGWGIRIIGQIAEKYGGTVRVENREGTVAVLVLLFRRGKV